MADAPALGAALRAWSTGYVLGSFPSAVLVARTAGIDPRREGEGNPGAVNVARLVGLRAGAAVASLDLGKGALAAGLGRLSGGWWPALLGLLGAMSGHAWPPWWGLRGGGRSVATLLGGLLVLGPVPGAASLTVMAVLLPTRRRRLAVSTGLLAYPAFFAALTADRRRLGGIGLAYLLVAARFWDTRSPASQAARSAKPVRRSS